MFHGTGGQIRILSNMGKAMEKSNLQNKCMQKYRCEFLVCNSPFYEDGTRHYAYCVSRNVWMSIALTVSPDVCKEYDTVCKTGLLQRSHKDGMQDSMVYLAVGKSGVKLGRHFSERKPMHLGVRQASFLVQLLYSSHVADIPTRPWTEISQFAGATAGYASN
jgi:hypothetical protein